MREPECIFCRIIDGEIPSAGLYEDDLVFSFMDINPVNSGHCLVVPKRHVESLLALTGEEAAACIQAVKIVAKAVMAATGWPGLNVLQNNDQCAGQVVPHCHFHVIPRNPKDGFSFGWRQGKYEKGEMEALREKIAANIK